MRPCTWRQPGVSNLLLGEAAPINLEEGTLLCFVFDTQRKRGTDEKNLVLMFVLFLLLSACGMKEPAGPQTLTVMTHDSFEVSEDVLAAFEAENNAPGPSSAPGIPARR